MNGLYGAMNRCIWPVESMNNEENIMICWPPPPHPPSYLPNPKARIAKKDEKSEKKGKTDDVQEISIQWVGTKSESQG